MADRRRPPSQHGQAYFTLCADIDGFSLHAAVRVEAQDRQRLEQMCRYVSRPALSNERVQLNAAGQAGLKLKTS
ncbi:MAG: transposase [Rubrivivax sp.]|nr:transposase [Rubrivivax sp.]